MNDLSFILSFAAFVSAVISPICVEIISYFFKSRQRKQEYVEQHKHEVIEKYLHELGEYIYSECKTSSVGFGASHSEIFMYVPEDYWKEIEEVHRCLNQLSIIKTPNFDPESQTKREELVISAKELYLQLCKDFAVLSRSKRFKHYTKTKRK